MALEAVAFGALLLIAVLVLVLGWGDRNPTLSRRTAPAILLPVLAAVGWLVASYEAPPSGESIVTNRPNQLLESGYASSDTCRACHPGNHATWQASYHRSMTRVATPESVKGDFDDRTLQQGSFSYHLDRDGDRYLVEIDAPPDGYMEYRDLTQRRVMLVTGSHHYQVYWLDTPNDREVEQFPFAYLVQERRWVPRASALLIPWREFPGVRSGGWGRTCIRCHTTRGRPGLGPGSRVDSQVTEFGIACEACHGPGEEHVRRHREPLGRYRTHLLAKADPSIVNPAHLSHRRSVEVCGQCHGIIELKSSKLWQEYLRTGSRFKPGEVLGDTAYAVSYSEYLRTSEQTPEDSAFFEKRFWPDGTVRVVGREYNGLVETPCFQDGTMTCLSCHAMHKYEDDGRSLREWADDQLRPGMRGDLACVQCHDKYESQSAARAHSHHPAGAGNECYNCHMPHTVYGLLKAVRSHMVDSPDVRSDVEAGRPNACNQCHLNRTLQWTARYLDAWYGISMPELDEEQRSIAASLLAVLKGDAAQRALAAWTMGWEPAREISGESWIAPHLAQLLDDPPRLARTPRPRPGRRNTATARDRRRHRRERRSPDRRRRRRTRPRPG